MKRRTLAFAGAGFAAALAGAWWATRHTGPSEVEQRLWTLNFATPDGGSLALADFRGRPLVLNFWATWCAPCKQELPEIEQIYNEKKGGGLVVLEVNWQEPADTAKAYFADRNLPMPVLLDTNSSVFNQYRLQGLPDHFFIGRDGKVAALYFGQLTADKMRDRLAQAGLG